MSEEPYIALSTPNLCGNEKAYALDCVESSWISSVGAYVGRFERDFAEYVGAPGAVAVSCGTAALHLALLIAGVKPGDEVFVPALTFIAPVNAIAYLGAVPLFIDSERESFGVSASAVQTYIEENCVFRDGVLRNSSTGRRISALVAVHLMGRSCDVDALASIASEYSLKLVEDAAEGIGCLRDGRHVGNRGVFGCFSFNGNKTLTTGGGGMAVSKDPALLKRLKHLSTQAKSDELLFEHDEIGYNYRMNNIQAALGVAQLEHLPAMLARKREIHAIYESRLAGMKTLRLLKAPPGCACWMALVETRSKAKRDALIGEMAGRRIQARPFWALNNTHPMYRSSPKGPLPVAEELVEKCVSVPCASQMDDAQVERVISALLAFDEAAV